VGGRARKRRFDRLVRRDGYRCVACNAIHLRLIQSHEVPLSEGGPDVDENVYLRCGRCHAEHDRAYGLGFGGAAVGEG
jgi:5-methylcytosine-specific restriction endonuclease McrA